MLAFTAYLRMLWGLFLFCGFLASQFVHPDIQNWIWIPLFILAFVTATILSSYQDQHMRVRFSPQINAFYIALGCYCVLWLFLVQQHDIQKVTLFEATVILFAYMVVSLWQRNHAGTIGAGVTTALAVLGYYWLPGYFWLWMALLSGGMLVGSGVYTLLRGRKSWQTSTT